MYPKNPKSSSGVNTASSPSIDKSAMYDEVIENYITVPPDGGWGWIVVIASFICNMVVDGSTYAFGIFLDDITETFKVHPTTIAIANSLMSGCCFIFGPISCALVNRYGFRIVGFIGGLIAAIAFFVSTYMKSVVAFLFILGALGGFGFCFIYVPSVVVIGFYFDKWRALATSIAVTGSAVGIIVFPPVMQSLLKNLIWQDKFRILAAAFVVVSFLALLYRPLKPIRVVADENKKMYDYLNDEYDNESMTSADAEIDGSNAGFRKVFSQWKTKTNTAYPTTSELIKTPKVYNIQPSDSTTSSTFLATVGGGSIATILKSTRSAASKQVDDGDKLSTVYEVESIEIGKMRKCCIRCKRNCRGCFKCWERHCCTQNYLNRPMYRDDIFYGASIATLPHYSTSVQTARTVSRGATNATSSAFSQSARLHTLEYHMSVSRVATQKDVAEQMQICKCCPEAVTRTLATMLDFSLLKSPSFFLLAMSGLLTTLGMYSPFLYIELKAKEEHVPQKYYQYLLSIIGATNAIGRILSGIVSSIPSANLLVISYVSLLINGVSTFACYFFKDVYGLFTFATLFGLTIACLSSIRAPIVVDMLGLEKLTNAFGILLLFQGIASFTGVPLSGVVMKATNSYSATFLFSGTCLFLSAVLLIPIGRVSKWEKRKS